MKNLMLAKKTNFFFCLCMFLILSIQLYSQTVNWTTQVQQAYRFDNIIRADYISSDKWDNCYSVYPILENHRERIVTKKIADISGNWERIYIPQDTAFDCHPTAIQTDALGESYVLGKTWLVNSGIISGLLLKYSISGNLLWEYKMDTTGSSVIPMAMKKDNSGNIIIVAQLRTYNGTDYYDYLIFKINSSGNLVWKKTYGERYENEYSSDLWIDNNNDICVSGIRYGLPASYLLTVKYSASGGFLWSSTHSNNNYYPEYYKPRITGDNSGNVYVMNNYWLNNEPRMRVNKYSPSGAPLWSYVHNSFSRGSSITRDKYGNILVGGVVKTNIGTGIDMAAFKLNSSNGTLLVGNFYEGQDTVYDYISDIKTDTSGNIFLFGFDGYSQMMKLIKVNNFLKVKWQVSITRASRSYNISNNNDGSIFVTADKDSLSYRFNMISRITDLGASFRVTNPSALNSISPEVFSLEQNYPNPFNPVTSIKYNIPGNGYVKFNVYDMLGQVVLSKNEFQSAGSHEIKFNGSDFSSGIYFYSIESNGFNDTKKMLLVK